MRIDVRLARCVKSVRNGQIPHGIVKEIAEAAHVHRHTVAALLKGKAENVTLQTLANLAQWLRSQGYQGNLPGDLIVDRPTSAWTAIRSCSTLEMVLGERLHGKERNPARRWIHRRDLTAAFALIERLHAQRDQDGEEANETNIPKVGMRYVPVFRENEPMPRTSDVKSAERVLQSLRSTANSTRWLNRPM